MGLLANTTANSSSSSGNNRGMGLLLVFFPEDNTAMADKSKPFSSPSSSTPSPSSSKSPFRRSNANVIISKAQSTISICALLIFVTLLLFTLSTFEPTIPSALSHRTSRRFLLEKPPTVHIHKNPTTKRKIHNWLPKLWINKSYNVSKIEFFPSTALQRMGTLYRRGTRAMSDLVVGHVSEDTSDDDLRLFLRVMHRSGLTARADVVFIFASPSLSSRFSSIIQDENDLFSSLLEHYSGLKSTHSGRKSESSNFDVTRFFKVIKKEKEIGEPLWGKRTRSNFSNPEAGVGELGAGFTVLSYGSVLSFDATELDAENSLAGFLDPVPLSLRRWACYPMLLGRVRRNFKHIMLVDVKNLIVVSDPLGRIRNRSPESVFLYIKSEGASSGKHGKKNWDKTQSLRSVNSGIIMGGARGIRRLSNAVLIEIVRAAMQHKKKISVTESAILSQLVGNEFMLKNIDLVTWSESIPDTSSLARLNSGAASTSLSGYQIIQRGTSNHDLSSVVKKKLCSSKVDSSVYKDC
ncbi:hypothetical protein L6164_034129 [Bauhinia variegata]|uniref:Uncharacterized protein n=1 Tax=Bauhinia variegata TaxID=167791 RepID=A0ACB9KTY6_BAUVA|nr:hypothetical protein L6164_034129 [Bauhinia variegata]